MTSGDEFVNVQYVVTNPVGAIFSQSLTQGVDNTINVPAGAPTTCIIQPPSTNTLAIKLKGAGADTGVLLHKTQPSFVSIDPTVSSFILNLAAGSNQVVVFTWI